MSSVRIPPVLRDAVDGHRTLPASGSTVGEVLDDLFARHPALRERVTEEGQLSRFINVYVNDRDVRFRQGLDTPVTGDDTIIILPAMAGGSR